MTPNLWDTAKAFLTGKFIAKRPTSSDKKFLNEQFNITSKETRERTVSKAQSEE